MSCMACQAGTAEGRPVMGPSAWQAAVLDALVGSLSVWATSRGPMHGWSNISLSTGTSGGCLGNAACQWLHWFGTCALFNL